MSHWAHTRRDVRKDMKRAMLSLLSSFSFISKLKEFSKHGKEELSLLGQLIFFHLIVIPMIRIALRLRIVIITCIDFHAIVGLVIGHNQLTEMIGYLEIVRRGLWTPDRSTGTHPFLSRILKGILNVVSTIGVGRGTASASTPPSVLSFSVLMNITHSWPTTTTSERESSTCNSAILS